MKSAFLSFLLFGSAFTFAEDLVAEPPLRLIVSVGGKEVEMTAGTPAQLNGEFKDPEVKVSISKERSFRRLGLAFDYPAGYAWEADGDKEVPTWTMNGPDATIILTHTTEEIAAADIAEEQRKTYGGDAVRKPVEETFGGREFKGWKVEATLSGTFITVRCYVLKGLNGNWILQIVDSGSTEAEKPSAELKRTMHLLGRTIKTKTP